MESMHHKDNHTLIADLVKDLPKRDLPIVYHNAPLKDVVRAMVETVHSRLLYVVDDEGKLLGSISLGSLMRHVFVEFHEPRVHSRSMIDSLVNETAEHLMRPRPLCAAQDDAVRDVLGRLVADNVKEFPVVDDQQRVVADLTAVDLIKALLIDKPQ